MTLLCASFIVSCDDDVQQLEADLSSTPYTVGFEKQSDFVTFVADGTTQPLRVYINSYGGELTTVLPSHNIQFEIDPASTAAMGTQYNVVTTGNSVNIADNAEFTFIDLEILTGSLNTDGPDTIIINLTDTTNGVVADQFKTMTINIQGSCFSNLGGEYQMTVTSSSGGSFSNLETITQVSDTQYHTTTTGTFGVGGLTSYGATNEWYYFDEICNQILVPGQNLADGFFSNTVTGVDVGDGTNGSVDPTTGVIHVEYEISFSAGNVTYSADYVPN